MSDLGSHVLLNAADRLSGPGKWTTEYLARDAEGKPVVELDAKAVCWCVLGACIVEAKFDREAYTEVLDRLHARVGYVPTWNDADGQTQENIVATLREVAADETDTD